MIINFEEARIMRQMRSFRKTGIIPEAIYAGHQVSTDYQPLSSWANSLLVLEMDNDFNLVLNEMHTTKSTLKFPYVLSKYRRGINPIDALMQEYQAALFKNSKSSFDTWIIEIVKQSHGILIDAISHDIIIISDFIKTYKPVCKHYASRLAYLLSKFESYVCILTSTS